MFVGLQIIQIEVLCVLIVNNCKQFIIEQIIGAICEVDIIYDTSFYVMVYFANFGAPRTWRGILKVHNMQNKKKLEYFNTDLKFLTQCFYSHVPPYTPITSYKMSADE